MNKFLNIIKIILFIITLILNYLVWTKTRLLKRNTINQNKTYQIISILVFLIIIVILYRISFDKTMFYNKYIDYYREFAMEDLKQNLIYFNTMFIVLLIYRKLNNKKISN